MQYLVVEINGRQYKVAPGQTIEVDKLPEETKKLSVEKVLLSVDDKKVEIGKPYLKETVELEVLQTIKKPKVRVATYKAKSNFRKVIGQNREMTQIRLAGKTESVKKS